MGVIILCIPLTFYNYWPQRIKPFFAWYWYFSLTYCLPFFFTFMLLKNNFSIGWSMNSLTGVVLCILFLDHKSLLIVTPLGAFLGTLMYYLTTNEPSFSTSHYKTLIITYSTVLLFGFLFLRRKEILYKTQYNTLTYQSAAIAHEMRTPLGNINMIGHTLKSIIARYKTTNTTLSEQSLLTNKDVVSLEQLTDNLRETVKGAQTFIDLMLVNLKEDVSGLPCSRLSMKECIEKIMNIYPFTTQEQKSVHLNFEKDFTFSGNEDFFQHVIFNLLKNSLYFIHAAHKGEIFICIQTLGRENNLIFKDTGPGIEPKKLTNIFKPFHSSRPHGTGIGLTFCKKVIESFGGKISVESELNVHTTFTISFHQ